MSDQRVEVPKSKPYRALSVMANRNVRNVVILIIAVITILALNSLIPMLYFEFGYTKGRTDYVPYSEYIEARDTNNKVRLTTASSTDIKTATNVYNAEWNWNAYIENYAVCLSKYESGGSLGEFFAGLKKWDLKYYSNDGIPTTINREEFDSFFKEDRDKQIGAIDVRYYTKYFFQDFAWYVDAGISIASALILYYSMFNYLISDYKEKYVKYNELKQEMDELTQNALDPFTFEPWLTGDFNKRRKIEQHIANIKYKVSRLEQRTPAAIKQKFKLYFSRYTLEDPGIRLPAVWNPADKLTHRERRYFRRRENLMYMLSEEYIRDYVKDSKVKHYKEVSPIFVYSGTAKYGKTTDSYSLIETDAERISRDAGKKVPTIMLNSFVFALIIAMGFYVEAGEPVVFILMAVIARVVPLILQVILSFEYTNRFMDTQLIPNLLNRKSIALLYLAEMKNGTKN